MNLNWHWSRIGRIHANLEKRVFSAIAASALDTRILIYIYVYCGSPCGGIRPEVPSIGHLEKCVFSAIAASTPYSNPHIRTVYCGSPCGVFLHSRKNRCFSRCPIGHLEKCVFSAIAASTPYSNPHIRTVYCGSPCGVSLHSRKNRCFSRCPIGHLEKCVFPRLLRQCRNRILVYARYTAVLRATIPCTYVKTTIFRSARKFVHRLKMNH